ncbi:hypothetical protein CJF31_00009474 [Rutstroemia sp. NJR-2017a BVV2]|nr:hypothetical protein CJF31_00009474 [Rutstroemia sp. NJR-2017a BVV2]
MEAIHKRTSSIDRNSVESILAGTELPSDAPSPHIGTSPNRVNFSTTNANPPVRPTVRPDRALSYTHRRPNRLSLTFPVAPSNGLESSRPTPTSSTAPSYPGTPAESTVTTPSPNDPNGFLVALAAQERRVLELKEELCKAETELTQLKKQWALHESTRKRAEIRHVEKLQPLQLERGSLEEGRTTTPRQSVDMDRKKALLANPPHLAKDSKNSRRKVITGGHTRTLSLLSPERTTYNSNIQSLYSKIPAEGIARSTTMPDTSIGITKVNSNRANRHSYQSGVTHGAKNFAEDVKTGIWNFLEDLRQATVGEEAVNGTSAQNRDTQRPLHKHESRGSLRGRPHNPATQRTWDSLTGANSIWQDPDILTTPMKPTNVQKRRARPISFPTATVDDDDWSNWDSPAAGADLKSSHSPLRWSGSSTLSGGGPVTPGRGEAELGDGVKIARPETPTAAASRNIDEIQWPALLSDKLTPSNLKKTVSSMMQEWENSLTPPLEDGGVSGGRKSMGRGGVGREGGEDFLTGSPRGVGRG